jgi:hypothetical protein
VKSLTGHFTIGSFLIGHQEVVPLSPNLPVLQPLLQLDMYLVMMGLQITVNLIVSCPPRDMPPTAEPLVSKMVPISNIVDDPEPPTSTRTGLVQRVEHALTWMIGTGFINPITM